MYVFFLMVEPPVAANWPMQLLKRLGSVRRDDDGGFVVTARRGMDDGWIAVTQVDSVIESQQDMERVSSMVKDPLFFMVEGRDTKTNFANQLLLSIDDTTKTVIDNDHGYIDSLKSFQTLARAGVAWLTLSQAAAVMALADGANVVKSMMDVLL